MNRHDLKSMSAELPWSVDDFVAFNRVQAATHMVEFWAQEQRLKHLNEYCDKAVAEITPSPKVDFPPIGAWVIKPAKPRLTRVLREFRRSLTIESAPGGT
jgi:hypothetical protein